MKQIRSSLSLWKNIARLHLYICLRRLLVKTLFRASSRSSGLQPEVTVFVSSLNTRYPLELTLKSFAACTEYPNIQFKIADNNSNDGSREYLQNLRYKFPVEVIYENDVRPHAYWLDMMMREAITPYWAALDSDMLFLAKDPLSEMISILEKNASIYLVAAEFRPGHNRPFIEPTKYAAKWAGSSDTIATWIFVVRTALRDHVTGSFGFDYKPAEKKSSCELFNDGAPQRIIFDTTGRLLEDMKEKNLGCHVMPKWFRLKYYHFGSLSWAEVSANNAWSKYKAYQLKFIQKLCQTYLD